MTKTHKPVLAQGPALRALHPWTPTGGRARQLLSDQERARLAAVASIVRFKKGEVIYREGDRAEAIFNVIRGVVAAYKEDSNQSRRIFAFLLSDDLFGLSAEGKYANSTRAVSPVTVYRMSLPALRSRLPKDPQLEFHLICKLCQELCQAQRHAILLSQRKAIAKLAMFLQLIEQLQFTRGERTDEIFLPMQRSDIGEYVGMTLAAVSRAFQSLARRGIIKTQNRRYVRIVDRMQFERFAGESPLASTIKSTA